MKLADLRDLLLTIGVPVSHYNASEQPDSYIVWAEEGPGNSEYADNQMNNQSLQGTIDYFTKIEFDPNFDLIQEKLDFAEELAWELNSIQHEEDTGYIHYEWVSELI
jgi:hypothetical protein